MTQSYDYDPFGIEKDGNSPDPNPFRYAGEYTDFESGYVYLRARYYAPQTSRMLSEDTKGGDPKNPQSFNLYIYCWNNPIRYVDLTGNWPELTDITRTAARWLIANPINVYATQKGWFSDLFSVAGFTRDSGGIYHARQDALQQYGGYNDFYDTVFHYATSMDKAKFEFSMGGTDYIFWGWKGDYLNLGAGAELGIYTRFLSTDHWLVDTSIALPMTLTLNDKSGNQVFSYSPNENQWWITGFDPCSQGVQASNLTAIYTVNFSKNKDMYRAFKRSLGPDETRWTFDSKKYTATFTF